MSMYWKHNMVKMAIFSKLIFKFIVIPIKISPGIFVDIEKP